MISFASYHLNQLEVYTHVGAALGGNLLAFFHVIFCAAIRRRNGGLKWDIFRFL